MVDWCYIFLILLLGVYPASLSIYNVGAKGNNFRSAIVEKEGLMLGD